MNGRSWMQARPRRSMVRQLVVETFVFGLVLFAIVAAMSLVDVGAVAR